MSTSHSNGGGGVNAIKKERTHHSPLGTGLPKKGGAGGKGTWGKGGLDDLTTGGAAVDSNDPNYCSEDEVDDGGVDVRGGGGKQRPDVKVYSLGVDPLVAIIQEHLLSADLDDTANSLKEVKPFTDATFEQFVKKAIVTSMEHHAYERELISKLLSKFYNEVIPSEKITDGFQACLNQIDDIVLDNPDAPEVLAKFLARAIVDEIIAPAFLTHAKVSSPRAEEVLATASGLVTEKHRIDRLAHIWGPGDLSSVKRLKQEVDLLLREFLTNGDMDEADKSVRKLNAPSFHFQVIKQAVRIALQLSVDDKKKLSKLLVFFHNTGLVTSEHCERGFRATYAALKDISLDIPNAEKMLAEFVDIAKEDGYLSKDFQP